MKNKKKQSAIGVRTWAPIAALILAALATIAAFFLGITLGLTSM